jgi:hypothetical protein
MRAFAHAIRSVIGTNGVSDRLRRLEFGVAELRQGAASAGRPTGVATVPAPMEALPPDREPAQSGAPRSITT